MKKLITLLLVLGFSMPVMADGYGEKSDDNVDCEKIFQGSEVKGQTEGAPEDTSGTTNDQKK